MTQKNPKSGQIEKKIRHILLLSELAKSILNVNCGIDRLKIPWQLLLTYPTIFRDFKIIVRNSQKINPLNNLISLKKKNSSQLLKNEYL